MARSARMAASEKSAFRGRLGPDGGDHEVGRDGFRGWPASQQARRPGRFGKRQHGPMAAAVELEQFSRAVADDVVVEATQRGHRKPCGPGACVRYPQRRGRSCEPRSDAADTFCEHWEDKPRHRVHGARCVGLSRRQRTSAREFRYEFFVDPDDQFDAVAAVDRVIGAEAGTFEGCQ